MNQSTNINEPQFRTFYEPLLKCYGEEFKSVIMSENDICKLIFSDSKTVSIDELKNFIKKQTNVYVKSMVYRLIGVREIIHCRDNKQRLDVKWINRSKLTPLPV